MAGTDDVKGGKPSLDKQESSGSHGGFSGLMDGLKDKLSESKLHDAKVALIHKKYVILSPRCAEGLSAPRRGRKLTDCFR